MFYTKKEKQDHEEPGQERKYNTLNPKTTTIIY